MEVNLPDVSQITEQTEVISNYWELHFEMIYELLMSQLRKPRETMLVEDYNLQKYLN